MTMLSTPAQTMGRVIVAVKLVALILAVATAFLTYKHQFEWYTALIAGVLAYVLAKPVGGLVVGYFLGREDARNLERDVADLMNRAGPSAPQIKQELIDNAPSGTKERVAYVLNTVEARAAQKGLTAAFKTRGHNFMTMESSAHEALVKEAMATGVEETMKHFDQKAQFEKLLHELKVFVFSQRRALLRG